ncbi:MAG: DNA-protecting protein DprA [Candidatus Berkelbacteria bacterium]|nr:MAG: DNA-protecting protein DprA [Candidatus Berkelbacteria bacterium]QQG51451.1 MAG: DNA-protecting protein DprA [Candidatus Berkelbacteria bacterium]
MSKTSGYFKDVSLEEIISLSRLEVIGPLSWQKLRRGFKSATELLAAKTKDLIAAGLTQHQAECFRDRDTDVSREMKLLKSRDIKLITVDDAHYPALLKEIPDLPLWLYYRGDLGAQSEAKTLTVVGTRKPSTYAQEALKKLLLPELLTNITTVSGLAYGVDKSVHELSLRYKGRTIAVLAGGLDGIYPTDHTNLAENIIDSGGLLLSEYPPLSRPQPYKFPVRNRIGAALSPATVIVEAKIRSGSLTTAKSALDYNRDIFAIPADITRTQAEGTNMLIKHGAILLDDPSQLLQYYGLENNSTERVAVDSEQARLLNLLTDRALDLDAIVSETGQNIEEVLGLITELELAGVIYQVHPGQYQQIK